MESLSESNLRTFPLQPAGWYDPAGSGALDAHLFKESTDRIYRVVTDAKFAEMCRHNVMGNVREPSWYYRYWDQNSKLLIRLNTLFPTISDGKNGKYQNSIPLIYELERRYGANEAIYFASSWYALAYSLLNAVPSTTTLTAQLMIPMDLQGCWIRIST